MEHAMIDDEPGLCNESPSPMNELAHILVIDDEKGICDLLVFDLSARGYAVSSASNGEQALILLATKDFQLVISDVRMPGMGGLETLEAIKKVAPHIEVILVTGHGTIETAVKAMKDGAYDFILKPFNIEELAALVEKALEKGELKAVVALHEASRAVFESINLDTLLPVIVKLAVRLLRADDASIMLLERGRLSMAASWGVRPGEASARLALGERLIGGKLGGHAICIDGPPARDLRFQGIEGLDDVKASLLQPLVVSGMNLGLLSVNRASRAMPFSPIDVQHMAIFAAKAAQAVHNAGLHRSLLEAQSQLIHSEKINAIGMLAAGIAHELNNPLTSIMGSAQFLLASDGLTAQQREDAQCVLEQSERCRVLSKDILNFVRKQESRKEEVRLYPLLESSLKFARFDFPSGIAVVRDWPEPAPILVADAVQLQQVFINLMRNAAQAMEESVRKDLVVSVQRGPGVVRILFADSGRGIPASEIAQVFNPFFTTKPASRGTGLGLSICKSIVLSHGGSISVASEPGRGATFTVELPIREDSPV